MHEMAERVEDYRRRCENCEMDLEYETKKLVIANSGRLTALVRVDDLLKEIDRFQNQLYEVRNANRILKLELKGKIQ
jgi:hypothetical protein